jgi:NAD(P)H dehydrogenase (quinone)
LILHPPTPGRALWVHVHPRPDSLNGHLFREGTAALSERYDAETTDLYAQRFNPVLGNDDLGDGARGGGNISTLVGEAYEAGQLPADVRGEQAKLAAAVLLVLQFPLWWYGTPAVLKGWFDRVLTAGFAYGDSDPELGVPRRYCDGGLAGRRALIVVTAGEDERSIGHRGISGDLDSLLFPLTHGVLWYVGIESLALHVIHDADGLDADAVDHETRNLRDRLHGIADEPARTFRRLRDGDYAGTRALHEDLLPGRTDLAIHLADTDESSH